MVSIPKTIQPHETRKAAAIVLAAAYARNIDVILKICQLLNDYFCKVSSYSREFRFGRWITRARDPTRCRKQAKRWATRRDEYILY